NNLSTRPRAWLLRFMLLPLGPRERGASDRVTQACADILLKPSPTRDRLTVDLFPGTGDSGLARLERAYAAVIAASPIRERMRKAHVRDVDAPFRQCLINEAEARERQSAAGALGAAIGVDAFAPEELAPRQADATLQWDERKAQARAAAQGGGGA